MCGIIGYIGRRFGNEIILNGLKHLEYRGYDSAGISVITSEGLLVKKAVGRIENIHEKLNFLEPLSNLCLGHTRWATHGGVTDFNAHPHVDCNEEISVVHNGIIDNYLELKNELILRGHVFRSETDTEVIPHLIEEFLKSGKSFEEACFEITKILKGTFALVIAKRGENKLIGIKKGSPLVVGVGDKEYFLASDIPAFIDYTKKVVYLNDFDVVVASNEKVEFYNLSKGKAEKVEKKIYYIEWDAEKAKRGEFDHFMLKEILEQVETIKKASYQDLNKLKKFAEEIKKNKKVFFVAAGSSYHASLVGCYLFSKVAGILPFSILASEFKNFIDCIDGETLIIAISQSGETYDVLEAVREAKKRGAKIFSIVNVNGSSLTWESDEFLLMNAGPEIGVAATKTYTAEIVVLTLLAYSLVNKIEVAKKKIEYLWNIMYNLTAENRRNEIKKIAEFLKDKKDIFIIGRNLLYPTAMEGALKLKEISYIHAEAFAGGELKHGTLALFENGIPCIALVDEETKEDIISNAKEIKARGGFIIGISPENHEVFDYWFKIHEANYENPIIYVVPLQILAYYLAVLRGYDPDKPRNLAKVITVK